MHLFLRLDIFLTVLLLFSIISSFIVVKVWRKKKFVKTLYIEENVSNFCYILNAIAIIGMLIKYYISKQENNILMLFGLLLFINFVMLFGYLFAATYCIYLNGNKVVKSNLFHTKQILTDHKTKIIEKFDVRIIKSNKKSIRIYYRYIDGSVNNFIYEVRKIIDECKE